MSFRYYGRLHLVPRGRSAKHDARHADAVETFPNGRSHVDVAKELWALAGDDARVNALASLVSRAYERSYPALFATEIEQMLDVLDKDALERALKRTVVDEKLIIPPEQMVYVRKHTRLINVAEARGDLAEVGILEGIGRVSELETILGEARDRKLDIAFD